MSNIVPSPFSDDFPGAITLPDALTFPQILAFEAALVATRGKADALSCVVSIEAVNQIITWNITGLPEKPKPAEIFEGRDYKVAGDFYKWVLNECAKVFRAEKVVPKESGSKLTNTLPTPKEKTTKTENQTTNQQN